MVGFLAVLPLAACSSGDIELQLGQCANPDLVVSGQTWETDDTIPDSWRNLDSVSGTFKVSSDEGSGTFVGPSGMSLAYRPVTETFRDHPCFLP